MFANFTIHIYRYAFKYFLKFNCSIPAPWKQWSQIAVNAHLQMTPASTAHKGQWNALAETMTNTEAEAYSSVPIIQFIQSKSCSSKGQSLKLRVLKDTEHNFNDPFNKGSWNIMCKCPELLRVITELPQAGTYRKKKKKRYFGIHRKLFSTHIQHTCNPDPTLS